MTFLVLLLMALPVSANVHLTVGHWAAGLEMEIIQAIVDEYQAQNPGVTVELVAAHGGPWGRDQYLTMFAGDIAPDLLLLNSGNFELFASQGLLLPLDRYADADSRFDADEYLPASIEGSSLQGVLYGLPYDVSNHLPYYNRQMFQESGLADPVDWTWDELIDMAKTLTRDFDGDGNIDVYGLGLDAAEWHWPSIMASFDVELFNEDGTEIYATSPEFVEFMEWHFSLIYQEGIAPQDPGGIGRFVDEGVAIATFGPWYRPTMETAQTSFEYDVAVPPMGDKRGTVYYVDQFAIASTTHHPDEAWDLLRFIAGSEGWQIKMTLGTGGRSIPPLQEFATSREFLGYAGLSNHLFLDAFTYSERSIAGLPSGIGREFLDIWWPRMWSVWEEPQPLLPVLDDIERVAKETLGLK